MRRQLRVLVTGGGTGGHTLPAIATVDAIRLIAAEEQAEIALDFLYIGSADGLESRLAIEAGMRFVSIRTGKLRRSANPLRMLSIANL
jgi:UDP-N-acetylglucosamine--N-acetylmuramyl-(pentapeptide) pyrophosphoryl-undecaprenol N-acetylglucosamine transferase